jgi:hypothetical protein
MKYTLEVQEVDGELVIEFPKELVAELDWALDDVLVWKIEGETITLSKK